jgi:hypothetical protein
MKSLLCGLAVSPLFAAMAMAQPTVQVREPLLLTEQQLDGARAGWSLEEIDVSNTSVTLVEVYGHDDPSCTGCYLNISSPAISVLSIIKGGLP